MRAAIFEGVGKPLTIRQIDDPTPGPGQAVIKVGRCGICATDVTMTSGHGCMTLPPGSLLGHEFSGEVVALGKGIERLRLGDIVAAPPVQGCGHCGACLAGRAGFCAAARYYSGGFGEYLAIGERESVTLPRSLSVSDGALVEPLAVGRHGVGLAHIQPGDRVLVIGPGPIGLSAIFFAKHAGAGTISALASSNRREGVSLAMGANKFVLQGDDLAERVHAALGGPPDVVIEAAGVPGVIAQALALVRPLGTVISLGFCTTPDSFIPAPAMMKEIRLQFSMTYSLEDFQACVDTMEAGHIEPRLMISDTISLDALPALLETLRGPTQQLKVMVDPWA
jgi:(R,R)-butanediol dehydrogenase/meso-butanediol dehydrogenase/diacetyl reductase